VVDKIEIPPKLQKIIDRQDLTPEQIKFYASQKDTECKRTYDCPANKMTYYDQKGEMFCAEQFKFVADENNPYSFEKRVCHKYLGNRNKDEQDYLF
jgi:hypothetical protein